MPGHRTRKRKRAQQTLKNVEALQYAREIAKTGDAEPLQDLLRRLNAADEHVWALVQATGDPLDDEEAALVAQVVAPRLAAMTRGSVYQRPAM